MDQSKEFDTLTYSSIKTFRNCRRMYDLRYNRCLVPIDEDFRRAGAGEHFSRLHGAMAWARQGGAR